MEDWLILLQLSAEYIYKNHEKLENRLKLKSMGIEIDSLTEEQIEYLSSWEFGT